MEEILDRKALDEIMAIEPNVELTEDNQAIIAKYFESIDITDSNCIMNYGSDSQEQMAQFSEQALANVRTKDLGQVGESLTTLVGELKGFGKIEEKKGLARLFSKAVSPIEQLKTRYTEANSNVEKVVDVLDGHQVTLTKDVAVMDELFNANNENYKKLSLYIEAGKQKIKEAVEVTLPEMKAKAAESNDPVDAQAVSDYSQQVSRFEKKIHDLDLTRTVATQMALQIRMVQNNDTQMIEKIQSALVNTIPLWKSQMLLTLGLANSEEALKAERAVTDATNQLLKENAELLKQTSVGVAKEAERGIVDLETLQETHTKLIETIDEVMVIQREGHEKRQLAEAELVKLEDGLKAKLLETIN